MFQSNKIKKKTVGRRTGLQLFRNKKIWPKNFEDFFTESESSNITEEMKEEINKKRRTVGRRTGTTIEVGKRKFQNGVENYEDYWTKSNYSYTTSRVDGLNANESKPNVNKEVFNSFSSTNNVLNYNSRYSSHLIENSPVMHSTAIINDENIAISPLSTVARDFSKRLNKTTSFTGIENLSSSACKTTDIQTPSTNSLQSHQSKKRKNVIENIASSVDNIADPENLIKSQNTISNESPEKTEFDKAVPDTASKSVKCKPKKRRKISETIASEVQVRRSKKNKIPPLQYWRNERLIYKWNGSEFVDIKYEDKTAVNSILKRMKKSNKPSGHQKKKDKLIGGSKLLDNSVNAAKVKETLPKISSKPKYWNKYRN